MSSSLRIAITGSTGFIGSHVVSYFQEQHQHSILHLVRPDSVPPHDSSPLLNWDIKKGTIDHDALEGIDVIIHLAGANISNRWTPGYKREIMDSRVQSTRLLASAILKLKHPPKLFLCASATGYYGNDEAHVIKTEDSPVGSGFLAQVCTAWEREAEPVALAGIRTVILRHGVVLGKEGGALAKMLPAFLVGAGGRLGRGRQMFSWVSVLEIPFIYDFIMGNLTFQGPLNVVSPQPVSNAEFTRTLAKVLKRPAVIPVPALAIKTLFGEMGQELLLEGVNVQPQKLLESGYHFRYPELEKALQKILK